MQIYKNMNIGTAKVNQLEAKNIKHYMINIISPDKRYSVSQYKKQAIEAIEKIFKKGKTPIVVGGTGLYIDSLIYDIEFKKEKINMKFRKKLNKIQEEKGIEELYNMALKIDPEAMKKISINDSKRIMRVIEIYEKTGKTKTFQEIESRKNKNKYNYKIFGINIERELLIERINKRVDKMIEDGLIKEVENLFKKYQKFPTAMQAIGYKEVVEFLKNEINKQEMIEKIKLRSRQYAKRQITWFKRNKNIIWLDGKKDIKDNLNIIVDLIN